MIREPIVWGVVMILLGIIELLLFIIYLLLKDRKCRARAVPRSECPDDPVSSETLP